MREYRTFDVVGPIMIGPSSSHTAGAARLGMMAHKVAGGQVDKVTFHLHGSFAKTYKGHGTDRALLAGVMGIGEQDERLRDAYHLAEERGLDFTFVEADLGSVHPNTVRIEMTNGRGQDQSLQGASIGGGSIRVTEVNGFETDFSGDNPVLITRHHDQEGVISGVTRILTSLGMNVVSLNCTRKERHGEASMVVELEESVDLRVLPVIRNKVNGILDIVVIG